MSKRSERHRQGHPQERRLDWLDSRHGQDSREREVGPNCIQDDAEHATACRCCLHSTLRFSSCEGCYLWCEDGHFTSSIRGTFTLLPQSLTRRPGQEPQASQLAVPHPAPYLALSSRFAAKRRSLLPPPNLRRCLAQSSLHVGVRSPASVRRRKVPGLVEVLQTLIDGFNLHASPRHVQPSHNPPGSYPC